MIKIYRNFFNEDNLNIIENSIKNHSRDRWSKSGSIGKHSLKESYDEDRVAESVVAPPSAIPSYIVEYLVTTVSVDFDIDLYPDEPWSIQKYRSETRGHFYWHSDVLDFFIYRKNVSPEQQFLLNTRPNRKVSISVALNNRNEYEGGQFSIDYGDGNKTPVDLNRGDMIAFTSETFHGVEDVLNGDRNALIIWLVEKEAFIEWKELCSDLDFESQ